MACQCKNEDGTPSETCLGCTRDRMVNLGPEQVPYDDGFTARQIAQMDVALRRVIKDNKILHDLWVSGFLRGFEEGKKYGFEEGKNDDY
jgi:hypothetical protein